MEKDGDIYSKSIFQTKDTVLRKARCPVPLPSADSWAASPGSVGPLSRGLTCTSFVSAVQGAPVEKKS